MFTINVADKHKILSDLMNIFGKLHQKGFSAEQIFNICHTFFKSEVEDNLDFCLKTNKLESCASRDKIDEPTLHFKINVDFINKVLKIQKAVESIRELSSSIFTLDGEKVVLDADSNAEILQRITGGESTKPSLPNKSEVSAEEIKQLPDETAEEVATETAVEEIAETAETTEIAESIAEADPEISETENIAETEISEAETAITEISENIADSDPEISENENIDAIEAIDATEELAEIPQESSLESTLNEISLDTESTEVAEINDNIENIEITENSENSENLDNLEDLSADDLNLDFAENAEIDTETEAIVDDLPDILPISESDLDPVITEADDLGDLDSLGDLDPLDLDLGENVTETPAKTPSTSEKSDLDVLLEISDPTEEDLVELQSKLDELAQQK